jgi:DNA-binding CsgD family transcriptional regulator
MPRMSKYAPAKVQSTLRQREAAELRALGLRVAEIAQRMGLSETRVRELLEIADKNLRIESKDLAKEYRDKQLLLAEGLMADLLEDFRNSKKGYKFDKNGDEIEVDLPTRDPRMADQLRKWSEHVSKLTGAYAPEKQELAGPGGGALQVATAVTTADLTALSEEQLLQLESIWRVIHKKQD